MNTPAATCDIINIDLGDTVQNIVNVTDVVFNTVTDVTNVVNNILDDLSSLE